MKRKLWIILALAALITALCCGAALAEEYAFTAQPTGTLTVPVNEFAIGWATNFTPVKIQVCERFYYDAIVKTVTSGLNASMATTVSVNDFDKDFTEKKFAIRAFYGSGWDEYVEGEIQFDLTPFRLIKNVETTFNGEDNTFVFTWETGFIPTEIVIWRADHYDSIKHITSGLDTSMTYSLAADQFPSDKDIFLYFYCGPYSLSSGVFSLPWSSIRFRQQPTCTIDAETCDFVISWETSFTPTYVELLDRTEELEIVKTKSSDLSASMSWSLSPSHFKKYHEYILWVYYGDGHKSSQALTLPYDSLKFVTQPNCSYNAAAHEFVFGWKTSFKPKKIQLIDDDAVYTADVVISSVTVGLNASMACTVDTDKLDPDHHYKIRAYYTGEDAYYPYIDSAVIDMDWAGLNFTAQPTGIYRDDDHTFQVNWSTSFVPTKITYGLQDQIIGGEDGSETIIRNGLDRSMSLEIDPAEASRDLYLIRAYFNSDHYISTVFRLPWKDMKFTENPAGVYLAGDPGAELTWETSFKPVRYIIGRRGSDPSEPAFIEVKTIEAPISASWIYWLEMDESTPKTDWEIRAYYGNGDDLYIESGPFDFTVCGFTVQPVDMTYPYGRSGTITWETNFVPDSIVVQHVDSDGELITDPTPVFYTATEGEGTTYTTSIMLFGVQSAYFRIYVRPNENSSYAASNVFTVTENSREDFSIQPQDGYTSRYDENSGVWMYDVTWETSFIPMEVEIYSVDEAGERDDVYSVVLPDPTVTAAAIPMPRSEEGNDDNRTFRIRARSAEGERAVDVLSDPFTVTRPDLTVQDEGPFYLEEGETAEIHLTTNFLPDRVEVWVREIPEEGAVVEEEGPTFIEHIVDTLYPTGTSFSYTLTYDDVSNPEWIGWNYGFQFQCCYSNANTSGKIGNAEYIRVAPAPKFIQMMNPVTVSTQLEAGGQLEADLNFNLDSYEVVRRPYGDETADWESLETVEGESTHIEYPLEPTYMWERYDYRIRAFLSNEMGEALGYWVIESELIDVQFEGFRVTFDNNGGTDYFNLDPPINVQPMAEMRIDGGESFILPDCTMIPPDGMMFDRWELQFDAYADTGFDIDLPEEAGPGQTFQAGTDVIARPVWVPRTFNTAYAIEDAEYPCERRHFYVNTFLVPYVPADMVPYGAYADEYGNTHTYIEPDGARIRITWYQIVDGQRVRYEDQELVPIPSSYYPGGVLYDSRGPAEIGDYELVLAYKGTEVINQFFSITEPTGPQGQHTYTLHGSLDKVYDGEPVAFDPDDGKTFVIDGGETGWGVLEKNGEARFLWREYMEKGKEGFWQNMEEGAVPTDPGHYQLVIQEMDGKDWQDAALFEFEISGGTAPVSFTVSFDALGGAPGPEPQTVSAGDAAFEPADPMKIGSVFTGWYTDAACGAESRYSFDAPVTENMTLYAGWMNPEPAGFLKLPTNLTTIEDEAFAECAAEAVVIPNSVTAISGDPFAGSQVRYIYGFPGSEAWTFTENHLAYTFVPIDDAWLAGH